MKHPRPHLKMDKRMTGSSSIDDVLHEVMFSIWHKTQTQKCIHVFNVYTFIHVQRRLVVLYFFQQLDWMIFYYAMTYIFIIFRGVVCFVIFLTTRLNDISSALQILNYTYRDYIQSWYRKISDDERFKYDMRLTLQRVIIALSER